VVVVDSKWMQDIERRDGAMPLHIVPQGPIRPNVSHRFREPTLAAVAQRISVIGEAAWAKWDLQLRYTTLNDRLRTVDLTLTLGLAMPVWEGRNARPGAEQREWDRFHRALGAHENGHLDLYRLEAQVAYGKLIRSTPATIEAVMQSELQRIQRCDEEYDRRTDHGRRQNTPHGTTVIRVPAGR
jgi:predicted secreted Zn-dependent protease